MSDPRKRVAIIGSGISGLTSAYFINKNHDISLFEAGDYIGGHTATKDISVNVSTENTTQSLRTYAVDTGFIVFNDWTYPNFIRLMEELDVKKQETEMSFSVKNLSLNMEYNGNNLNSLFAQRRNIMRPKFLRIVRDILRFNRVCRATIQNNVTTDSLTLFDFIQEQGLSEDFTQNYILPMCAAIWSTSLEDVKQFPFTFFLQFFNNHGLLNVTNRPQWYTLVGGSRSYVEPLTKEFKSRIHLNSPVRDVQRNDAENTWSLRVHNEQFEFDEIVIACHSDQALACLAKPTKLQKDILSSIPYSMNDVVLHTDERVLPKRKLAWASWNYELLGNNADSQRPASVTYNMNILQCIEAQHTFCVTLNNTQAIDPEKILGSYSYAHPQFSTSMVNAQKRREEINNVNGLYFCGAYWYSGFHEDGVKSALDVCKHFGETW